MNEFFAAAIVLALIGLRFLLPLAVILGIGYLANRMSDHWEAAV